MSLQLVFLTNVALLNVDLTCWILYILDMLWMERRVRWRQKLGYRGMWEECACTGCMPLISRRGRDKVWGTGCGVRGVGCVA